MEIYINGMEMPTSCYDCNCFIRDSDGSDYCCLLMQDIADNGKRDDDCPLVPYWEPYVQTNADRVRAMTDAEIEDWFWRMHGMMAWYTDSHVFVHDWLKQEAER